MKVDEIYGFCIDLSYIKEQHPELTQKHSFTLMFLEDRDEWDVKSCFERIGAKASLELFCDILIAQRLKNAKNKNRH